MLTNFFKISPSAALDLFRGQAGGAAPPLIVGGYDQTVITLNEQAYDEIQAPTKLVIVPRATHVFEEPGTLEEVARLAAEWFDHYLVRCRTV